jgi:hypothetical protein
MLPKEAIKMNSKNLLTTIVDADAHVNPSADMWEGYLPAPPREHPPKIDHGEDCDYVVFEGRRRKVNLISAQGGREGKDFKMHGRAADARSGGWMPAGRLSDMDEDGIDTAIYLAAVRWGPPVSPSPTANPGI